MSAAHTHPYAHPRQHSSFFDRLFASSEGAYFAAAIAVLYLCYTFNLPLLLVDLLWNALVHIAPTFLVVAIDKRRNPDMYQEGASSPASDNYAVKSEALRRIFGLGSGPITALSGSTSLRRSSWLGGIASSSDAPPGLGNWDNSCYQNSVLQGLSALKSLSTYLERSEATKSQDPSTTAGSLRELMANLNGSSNNGRRIWTPAKLKSMSSWQQQDAQEYFSKIMDDMEKETAKGFKPVPGTAGLQEIDNLNTIKASCSEEDSGPGSRESSPREAHNPLDGFLAQRVACTSCGFSEGLSMIPFNCLTVPLGKRVNYRVEDCLNEYTGLEEISGVECAKCTLLRTRSQLRQMTSEIGEVADHSVPSAASLPPELHAMVVKRLQAVEQALEEADVSDDTLYKKCQITKKSRVSSTKTRQAVIARAPQCLVIHVNRSVFDEYTGDQRKNLANVTYPKFLDLGPWCLGTTQSKTDQEEWRMNPTRSMIGPSSGSSRLQYVLRAAVTHYGRHENGHYICYREHPECLQNPQGETEDGVSSKQMPPKWWRLSDDDVFAVSEECVLDQGGVFMLFYERLEVQQASQDAATETAQTQATVGDVAIVPEAAGQTNKVSTAEDVRSPIPPPVSDSSPEPAINQDVPSSPEVKKVSTPQTMRTAGKKTKRRKNDFASTLQAVAAT